MDAARIVRDAQARSEALRAYAARHDHFAEMEQRLMGLGRDYEAEGAHEFGLRLLRAWMAEDRDPTPEGLPA